MKIVVGHDYYDGAGLMVDNSVMFLRKNPDQLEKDEGIACDLATRVRIGRDWSQNRVLLRELFIGGERVPYAISHVDKFPHLTRHFLYSIQDILDAVAALDLPRKGSMFDDGCTSSAKAEQLVREHMTTPVSDAQRAFLVDHRVVTGHTALRTIAKGKRRELRLFANYPVLKDFEAYRGLDAATAHMRIASFLSGVLTSSPQVVDLSDRSKIVKAGFDLQSSFRRAKVV